MSFAYCLKINKNTVALSARWTTLKGHQKKSMNYITENITGGSMSLQDHLAKEPELKNIDWSSRTLTFFQLIYNLGKYDGTQEAKENQEDLSCLD